MLCQDSTSSASCYKCSAWIWSPLNILKHFLQQWYRWSSAKIWAQSKVLYLNPFVRWSYLRGKKFKNEISLPTWWLVNGQGSSAFVYNMTVCRRFIQKHCSAEDMFLHYCCYCCPALAWRARDKYHHYFISGLPAPWLLMPPFTFSVLSTVNQQASVSTTDRASVIPKKKTWFVDEESYLSGSDKIPI